jgi:hypothetical protein
MTIERRDVTFNSGDSFVTGWFFLPEGGIPGVRVPAGALAPGTGGVKELYHEPFARQFAETGIAARCGQAFTPRVRHARGGRFGRGC